MRNIFKRVCDAICSFPMAVIDGALSGLWLSVALYSLVLIYNEDSEIVRVALCFGALLSFGGAVYFNYRCMGEVLKDLFGDRLIAPTFNNCHVSFTKADEN